MFPERPNVWDTFGLGGAQSLGLVHNNFQNVGEILTCSFILRGVGDFVNVSTCAIWVRPEFGLGPNPS